MTVEFNVYSPSELVKTLKAKMEAYSILFDRQPKVVIFGKFEDHTGELVFATSTPAQLEKVGNKHLVINYHGNLEKWTPYGSEFQIRFS